MTARRRYPLTRVESAILVIAALIVMAAANGCAGKTPRATTADAERVFTATTNSLAIARESKLIPPDTYHSAVLPLLETANATLEQMHQEALKSPDQPTDKFKIAAAAWAEVKRQLLQWAAETQAKK